MGERGIAYLNFTSVNITVAKLDVSEAAEERLYQAWLQPSGVVAKNKAILSGTRHKLFPSKSEAPAI